MTENELIKTHIEECEERIGRILGYMETAEDANTKFCERNVEVLKSVVIALEEIQQYRELGTVELLIKSNAKALFEHVELEQYRAIGTVEECTEAVLNIEQFYMFGRNKAIDEFAEKMKEFIEEDMIPRARTEEVYRALTELQDYNIGEIAEQMKGGE